MLFELHNVKKYFRLRSQSLLGPAQIVKALDGVSFSLKEGATFSLVGESGSGKTTLGRLMAGLYAANGGDIFFNGSDIRRLTKPQYRDFRRGVQMVFQDPYSSLDPRFTVERIMNEAFTLEKQVRMDERRRRIQEILDRVRLPQDILLRYPHEFSGGERQRLAIARALLCRPKLVILDEAVSSLDVLVQEEILKLLANLKKQFGLTYVFISHNLRVVAKISDKITVMYQGKIVETGSVGEVVRNPLHPYTQELLTAAMDYKLRHDGRAWALPSDGKGVDHGNGHWAMNIQ